jgi:hypothetical protein
MSVWTAEVDTTFCIRAHFKAKPKLFAVNLPLRYLKTVELAVVNKKFLEITSFFQCLHLLEQVKLPVLVSLNFVNNAKNYHNLALYSVKVVL